MPRAAILWRPGGSTCGENGGPHAWKESGDHTHGKNLGQPNSTKQRSSPVQWSSDPPYPLPPNSTVTGGNPFFFSYCWSHFIWFSYPLQPKASWLAHGPHTLRNGSSVFLKGCRQQPTARNTGQESGIPSPRHHWCLFCCVIVFSLQVGICYLWSHWYPIQPIINTRNWSQQYL